MAAASLGLVGKRGDNVAGMVLSSHIPEPSECGGHIGFRLVWVIAIVVLRCLRFFHARNESLYPIERVVRFLSLAQSGPRATFLRRGLNGRQATAWRELLSGLR